jgi:hypothetical protein
MCWLLLLFARAVFNDAPIRNALARMRASMSATVAAHVAACAGAAAAAIRSKCSGLRSARATVSVIPR